MGDELVVSVTPDEYVRKGPGRPHFTLKDRMAALKALHCVNSVVSFNSFDASTAIFQIKPDYYVKGIDYDSADDDKWLQREIAAIKEVGGEFRTTKATKQASSSHLINTQKLPEDVLQYLETAKKRGFRDKILRAFDDADKLKILFVGEMIVDEYQYVTGLGKPSKEFVLATAALGKETFRGGIEAASKQGEFKNVHWMSAGQPIHKLRYVDRDFTRKLFEAYQQTDVGPHDWWQAGLEKEVRNTGTVVVMDFGHGLMGKPEIEIVQKRIDFLAVNAQTNAGNAGFNPITKYERANLVCVDEPEARLATQIRSGSLSDVGIELGRRIKADGYIITCGKNGCLVGPTALGSSLMPAFSTQGLDTMGAGDAFLAVAAPLRATGLELEEAAFAGNVAGAIKTTIVGHRRNVRRDELIQTVEALLA